MATNTATAATTGLLARDQPADRSMELYGMNRDRVELVKRTVARGTSDDELALFLMTAKARGLDPFAKEIYAIVRPGKNGSTMTIQTGIDGYRKAAARTGDYDGQEGPFWCGGDGAWREVWTEEAAPAAAKVIVYRKGIARGFVGVASYKSYVQLDYNQAPTGQWPKMPDVQLAKCAEALALRKAFPNELGGIHTADEMEQADNDAPASSTMGKIPPAAARPAAPAPAPDVIDAEIVEPKTPPPPPAAAPPAPTGDTGWVAFLGDVAAITKAPTDGWSEDDVGASFASVAGACPTRAALNEQCMPWMTASGKRSGARVQAVRAVLSRDFNARSKALRDQESAAGGAA